VVTQRERILYELREAGERGVRGDTFLNLSIPRYSARVLELRKAGYDIRSQDDNGMARYRLVGVGGAKTSALGDSPSSPASGPLHSPDSGQLFDITPPSAYDPYSEAA
jgi:hypothetical protein